MPALFPYLPASTALHESFLMPWLPIDLWLRDCGSLSTQGLLDSGSTVNVMPYDLGIRLGAVWEAQTTRVVLTGNLAAEDARALLIHARVGDFPAVRLVFAWTHSENIPLLLGQVNFFQEFDVCLYGSRLQFVIDPARK